ncbi:MAG: helix-turn-helix domain-containing protein [Proteobacteria bacterium]|nr:helix-turn-helix domain-containing protein [Pseudomonadota bacterium]
MKSAPKLFSVLESLCIEGDGGITELSKKLRLGKSSIHRFLSVLTELGYVHKNSANGKYAATLKLFEIGAMVRGRIRLVQLARPYMEKLGRQFHETINLAFPERGDVVYIDKVESVETLRMDLAIGRRAPGHCTALGKVFLSSLSEEDLHRYFRSQKLIACTERTITSPKELKKQLDRVRTNGFAVDDRELDEGIRCIAAPVKDESGKTIAAISIAGPSVRLTMNRLKSLSEPLRMVTGDISQKLGYEG